MVAAAITALSACSSTVANSPTTSPSTMESTVASTMPTSPLSTAFSSTSVPTAQEQSIPTVAIGTSQKVSKLTDSARITLLKVIDPVTLSSSSNPPVAGSRAIGLDFSVQNLGGDSILGIMERHEPSMTVVVYGTNHTAYFGVSGDSSDCPPYAPTTVIPVGSSFEGCEFVTIPHGVDVAQVVISLVYGGLGGTPAAWHAS